ncbi:Mitotic spindle checkpoint component mad2 [Serendipita sp. 396]|nr:Mitotic spindle checkpoint component mad2 [Serendipita sp. 396]KAG8783810.1 Mitotic spindle checkpoint component mad2 [Serendipita sp. 397]KAG8826567.1 Mitotic spindle checkpoint component mad2 [Serendipita sp. 401]KAG8831317.1 Mitotic spindle checkpoint component mad2 [Serendipita sp. 400]KAG8851639.1 Mitotic spindle checkpoint component mad2 [Serendipita sp. 411]KAG8866739.1 Mitotic spindle checkpoint component mad2 [Serendipita sp. 405]KAG9057213.1 Mitotic spindle checkpoint component m
MQSQKSKQISLKGSTAIVTDFFKFAINTILYQRGVYPADDFHMVKKYGQTVMLTEDAALVNYLDKILTQVNEWLLKGDVTQLVLVLLSKDSRTPLERWVFDIEVLRSEGDQIIPDDSKPDAEIQKEIRHIIKQIVASVTFLPLVYEPMVFNILVYTRDSAEVPGKEWLDTDPMAIEASMSQQVKLRSFSTDYHRIGAMVDYRYES